MVFSPAAAAAEAPAAAHCAEGVQASGHRRQSIELPFEQLSCERDGAERAVALGAGESAKAASPTDGPHPLKQHDQLRWTPG